MAASASKNFYAKKNKPEDPANMLHLCKCLWYQAKIYKCPVLLWLYNNLLYKYILPLSQKSTIQFYIQFRAKQKYQISIYEFQQKLERESRKTGLYSYKTVRSLKGRCLQRDGLIKGLTIGVVFAPYCKFITSKALKIPVSHVIKKIWTDLTLFFFNAMPLL